MKRYWQKDSQLESLKVLLACALVACMMLPPMPAQAQKTYRDATSGFLNESTLVTSAAYTANGNGSVIDVGAFASGLIFINVTAVSGTSPSMTVNFQACFSTPGQGTAPSTANCVLHTAGTAITATGLQIIKVDHFPRWASVNYTITGTTPSFTFSVVGYFKPTS